MSDHNIEKKEFTRALFFPVLLIFMVWCVKLFEVLAGNSFAWLGIYPLKFSGLPGIILAPLIHGDLVHLFNNSLPLLILSVALFYFYKTIALRIMFFIWVIPGIGVWIFGRDVYHYIGASGLVYGLASFLFFSGLIRMNIKLLAISLLVIFLYGSMVWGIFPFNYDISWESHFFGGAVGLIIALVLRNEGPQKEEPEWLTNEEEDESDSDPFWEQTPESDADIKIEPNPNKKINENK